MNPAITRDDILNLVLRALEQENPFHAVKNKVSFNPRSQTIDVNGHSIPCGSHQQIWVIGSGKASASMARAADEIFGEKIRDGLVIVPFGRQETSNHIQFLPGDHPYPGKNSLAATYEMIHLLKSIPEQDIVFNLISGGTSSLLCMPADRLELEDLAAMYRILLRSGADISEINTVRTVCSAVKGGQLLQYLPHVTLIDLIISDVPGDDFQTIGSGPTTPGPVRFEHAFQILKKYAIWNEVPHEIRIHITKGMQNQGKIKPNDRPADHHQFLISSASKLAESVSAAFSKKGCQADVIHPAYNLPIGKLEEKILNILKTETEEPGSVRTDNFSADNGSPHDRNSPEEPSAKCSVFYGESSVHVSGTGKGGRNQEIALRMVRHLHRASRAVFLSIGTDGVDGPTDAAGAIADQEILIQAEKKNLDPEKYLENNDSYTFFQETGGLIKTGPTGNNLMDLQVLFIDNRESKANP